MEGGTYRAGRVVAISVVAIVGGGVAIAAVLFGFDATSSALALSLAIVAGLLAVRTD